jgi:hypothetical protein
MIFKQIAMAVALKSLGRENVRFPSRNLKNTSLKEEKE